MRGFNNKKSESNPLRYPLSGNDKKPISIHTINMNSQKSLKSLTPQQEYNRLKQMVKQKQQQIQSKQKMYRIQAFKNSRIKQDIAQVDKQFERIKYKITLDLLQKNKNNKDSPLFFNQNGLSPMELTLVDQKKHQFSMGQSFVCMICFQDIEDNQTVIYLPCEDKFHKDCAIQHLLGSKFCPNCTQIADLVQYAKRKMQS